MHRERSSRLRNQTIKEPKKSNTVQRAARTAANSSPAWLRADSPDSQRGRPAGCDPASYPDERSL